MAWSTRIAAWIVGNVVCVGLVALPDQDDRLFSISDLHGPSTVDAIGTMGLVLLWVPVMVATARAVGRERERVRAGVVAAAAGLLSALAVTVLADLGWWWVPPALGLGALQLWVLWRAHRLPGA